MGQTENLQKTISYERTSDLADKPISDFVDRHNSNLVDRQNSNLVERQISDLVVNRSLDKYTKSNLLLTDILDDYKNISPAKPTSFWKYPNHLAENFCKTIRVKKT